NLAAVFATGGIGHSVALGFEFNDTESNNLAYAVDTGDRTCPAVELTRFNCTALENPNPYDPWNGSVEPGTSPSQASGREYSFYLFDAVTLMPSRPLSGGLRWQEFNASGSGVSRRTPFDVSNSSSFWSYQGGAIFKPTPATS